MIDNFRPDFALLALLMIFLHFLMEPIRWSIYTDLKRNKFQTAKDFFHVFNITALISYLLPAKLGLPLRIFLIRRLISIDYYEISSVIIIDTLIYYGCWAFAGAVSALLVLGHIKYSPEHVFIIAGGVIIVIAIVYIANRKLIRRSEVNIVQKITNAVLLIRQNIADKSSVKIYMFSALVVVVDLTFHGLRHFALLEMLGGHLPLASIFLIAVLSISVGIFSLMPMGVGGYDATLTLLLVSYGVPLSAALAVVLSNRVLSIAVAIVLGGSSSLFGGIKIGDLLRRKGELENLEIQTTPKD